jgi:hypothetical protein
VFSVVPAVSFVQFFYFDVSENQRDVSSRYA